jgi:ATP-dependent 26S proteasome regulatory subunit
MNVLMLLTTNEETSRLHPALVRPGRCLAAVQFSAFDASEASAWLGMSAGYPMTLAELLDRRGDLPRIGPSLRSLEPTGYYL